MLLIYLFPVAELSVQYNSHLASYYVNNILKIIIVVLYNNMITGKIGTVAMTE